MEPYIEEYGNLIKLSKEGKFDAIVHGCNCKKNWKKGIASFMKKAYYKAFEVDLNSTPRLGEISVCYDYEYCDIINAYTQIQPGKNSNGKDSDFNRYKAIKNCMIEINKQYKGKIVGLPLIASGYAGLKWSKVKKIIKKELSDCYIVIIHLK